MTPDEQKMLLEFDRRVSYLMNEKEAFIEGWKAAIQHMQEKREQWEFSSHRRE